MRTGALFYLPCVPSTWNSTVPGTQQTPSKKTVERVNESEPVEHSGRQGQTEAQRPAPAR